MFIFKRVHHLRDWMAKNREEGISVGMVPTMGALHDGHLSLVTKCKSLSTISVVSIFVNPRQFNDPEDLKKYPRPVERDIEMLAKSGVDVLFLPDVSDIFPAGQPFDLDFDPGWAGNVMEGEFRPGHFKGMAEVVYRLLDIVSPDQLYMGQKDFQQLTIVQKLIADFGLRVALIMCPIHRESHGLAMSSRNVRLSDEARIRAGILYTMLKEGKRKFDLKVPVSVIELEALEGLRNQGVIPDYFKIVDGRTLKPVHQEPDSGYVVACCAGSLEGIRLIDNMIWLQPDGINGVK